MTFDKTVYLTYLLLSRSLVRFVLKVEAKTPAPSGGINNSW